MHGEAARRTGIVTDKDDNPMRSRVAAMCFVAAIVLFFFVVVPLLPFERPYFPAADSTFLAERLFRQGDCAGGYAIYEKRAANGAYDVSYLMIGRMKEQGRCGSPDIPGAIAAYRQAAARGRCDANFLLAKIAIQHPDVSGIQQEASENNLFASVLCLYHTSDERQRSHHFEPNSKHRDVAGLEEAFEKALERREAYRKLPFEQKRKIAEQIRDGVGYDVNPNPLEVSAKWKPTR